MYDCRSLSGVSSLGYGRGEVARGHRKNPLESLAVVIRCLLIISFLPIFKLPGGLVVGLGPDICSPELAWTCVLTVATCQKVIKRARSE